MKVSNPAQHRRSPLLVLISCFACLAEWDVSLFWVNCIHWRV